MFQNLVLAVQQGSQSLAEKGIRASFSGADTKKVFFTMLHFLTLMLGLGAIAVLTIMFVKPDLTEKFKSLSPYASVELMTEQDTDENAAPSLSLLMATPQQVAKAQSDDASADKEVHSDTQLLGNQKQQVWVTNWLAKRYRVANDASNMLVSAAYLTAKELKLDPLLILSVMAIESGLNPFAESPVGAQGLMQVMSKVHHEKFEDMGGIKAALNPVANIRVGALILKDYVTRGGSVEAGLKMYVGAAAFDNDSGYGSRVLAEYRRLKDVSSGKSVPTFTSPTPVPVINRTQETESSAKLTTKPVEHPIDQIARL
ncbi:lytic transglycosylase domain-containing protein [Undibacterium piscinae]|uniref:Lytic transglycosylase domain-containing protein n=1 Tax=Undibacterium piscinae TaxID=2495591 RepID=A0A6M4A197_9BURK|nr:lytic transglycosylase domain-containing protein [Undibacterium piscinae]